jgi:tetratricopeptide (TPR) repeat protein
LKEAKAAIELDPLSFPGWRALGISLAMLHQYQEAIEAFEKCLQTSARHSWALGELSWVFSLTGDIKQCQTILDELISRSKSENISWLILCGVSYFSGEFKQAQDYLDRAFTERECTLPCINVYPLCSFIRTDLRFRPYLDRINFKKRALAKTR